MSKKKLAVYDLDNTLYKKDTFKAFCKYILRKGNCSLRIYLEILVSYIMCIFRMRNWKSYKENVLFVLKGKNGHEINEITDEFVSELKQEKYRSELLKRIICPFQSILLFKNMSVGLVLAFLVCLIMES